MSQAKRAGAVVMKYGYNWRGEQVRRVDKTNTYTLYDESGHWLGNYDANGAALQQAIWLDDLPVGVLAKNSPRYVQPDRLGTPRAVIDPTRDVAIWTWDLKGEAFGNTPPDQDPDKDGTAFVFDMRFPGQRYDAATGFNQNYFRDYDSSTGRYGQSGPIGIPGDISTYNYVMSSPLIFFDIFGLKPVLDTKTCSGSYGLTYCDGKGGVEAGNCNLGCGTVCTQLHENEHKRFLETRHPGSCIGRPRGAQPWPKDYDYEKWREESFETECRADKITISCLKKIKTSGIKDKDIDQQLNQAIKRREDNKCASSGY